MTYYNYRYSHRVMHDKMREFPAGDVCDVDINKRPLDPYEEGEPVWTTNYKESWFLDPKADFEYPSQQPETREFWVGLHVPPDEDEPEAIAEFVMDVSDLTSKGADRLAQNIALRIARAHRVQVRWARGPMFQGRGQGHYVDPKYGDMS